MSSIVLQNIRVDFPIYGATRSLRTTIFQRAAGGLIFREGKHQERVVVRALNDVSLHLEEGDRLGLIGHNGSGKSTLLKVLAGIYEPIAGKLMVQGRVTPLFDMMPGLDPEDSGYENIFTAGMLLGMSRDELENRIPEIEEFCELGEYLSLPVRTYSTGMTMRLGFAIVTALDPGILLMDEGFGTGDLRFTERAAERADSFIGKSRIIVLASHSDSMIKSMCNKAAIMQEGQIVSIGHVDEMLEEYHELVHQNKTQVGTSFLVEEVVDTDTPEPEPTSESDVLIYNEESIENVGIDNRASRSNGAVLFTRAVALRDDSTIDWNYFQDEAVTFRFEYKIKRPVRDLAFVFRLNLAADPVSGRSETIVSEIFEVLSSKPVNPRESVIELKLPGLKLMPNEFSLYIWIGRCDHTVAYDTIDDNVSLPRLVIKSKNRSSGRPLRGLVPMNYEFEDFEPEGRTVPQRVVQKS